VVINVCVCVCVCLLNAACGLDDLFLPDGDAMLESASQQTEGGWSPFYYVRVLLFSQADKR
jgi:hypothetical protein